jgi:hypothetical protein
MTVINDMRDLRPVPRRIFHCCCCGRQAVSWLTDPRDTHVTTLQGAIQHLKRNGEDASVIDPQLITEKSDWGELVTPSEETRKYIENKFWSY